MALSKELGMSASFAGFAAGIFFVGYLVLQVPGGHLATHGVAKKFLTWSMVAWGVVSIATAYTTNETQLIALRFVLGMAEGGMLPVVLTMISKWFPDEERGRPSRRHGPPGRRSDRPRPEQSRPQANDQPE